MPKRLTNAFIFIKYEAVSKSYIRRFKSQHQNENVFGYRRQLKTELRVSGKDILKDPTRIINGDETNMELNGRALKCFSSAKDKNPYEKLRAGNTENRTVLLLLTPMAILCRPSYCFLENDYHRQFLLRLTGIFLFRLPKEDGWTEIFTTTNFEKLLISLDLIFNISRTTNRENLKINTCKEFKNKQATQNGIFRPFLTQFLS